MKPLTYREVRRKLLAAGFEERQGRGSHVKFVRFTREGVITAVVPSHSEIAAGTLRSILKQAFITEAEFKKL